MFYTHLYVGVGEFMRFYIVYTQKRNQTFNSGKITFQPKYKFERDSIL